MNLEDYVPATMYKLSDDATHVVEMDNPVTRYRVRLDPPYPMCGDLGELASALSDYCVKAWDSGAAMSKYRINPAVVDPYRVIDGTMPLPDLHQQLADLVHAFGYWAVEGALGRLRPEEPS